MHHSGEMFVYLVFQISWWWRFPSSSAEQTFTEKGAGGRVLPFPCKCCKYRMDHNLY